MPKHTFFDNRKYPGPQDCDKMEQKTTKARFVRPIDSSRSRSYTVICSGCPIEPLDRVVTFVEASLDADDRVYTLANKTHRDLAPLSDWTREVEVLDECARLHAKLNERQMKRHFMIMQGFADYFGRAYKTAKKRSKNSLYPNLVFTRQRLIEFRDKEILPKEMVTKLIDTLPTLFSDTYPQAVTNCNLSLVVCENPPLWHRMDLLFETTGFIDFGTWADYDCKSQCLAVFWDRFWLSSGIGTGITGMSQRTQVRELALSAAQINAILRYSFKKNRNGRFIDVFECSIADRKQLRGLLGLSWKT